MSTSKKQVEATTTELNARKTTDKLYKNLPPFHEVVVEVGPRQRVQNNKVVTVEATREVVFTKAGYEAMDRDANGSTVHIPSKVIGIPEYEDVADPAAPGGWRKDMVTLYFVDTDSANSSTGQPAN